MSLTEKFITSMQNTVVGVLEGSIPGIKVTPMNKLLIQDREIIMNSGTFIIIGLTGKIKGRIIYLLDPKSSVTLAGKMLMEELTELNDIAYSALSELSNMISGATLSQPDMCEELIEISPPTLFQGETVTISSLKDDVYLLPFEFESCKLCIFVAVDKS